MKFDKKDIDFGILKFNFDLIEIKLSLVDFETLDLGLVIQESRVFSESPLKAKKCELVLTKLLYLIYNGAKLSEQDATAVFFSITKTFQSKEVTIILTKN